MEPRRGSHGGNRRHHFRSGSGGRKRLGATLDTLPERTEAAREILNLEDGQSWRDGDEIFFLVRTEASENTGTDLARVSGTVRVGDDGPSVSFDPITSAAAPTLAEEVEVGLHGSYEGAALTAHAFDRAFAGVGMEALAWDNSW